MHRSITASRPRGRADCPALPGRGVGSSRRDQGRPFPMRRRPNAPPPCISTDRRPRPNAPTLEGPRAGRAEPSRGLRGRSSENSDSDGSAAAEQPSVGTECSTSEQHGSNPSRQTARPASHRPAAAQPGRLGSAGWFPRGSAPGLRADLYPRRGEGGNYRRDSGCGRRPGPPCAPSDASTCWRMCTPPAPPRSVVAASPGLVTQRACTQVPPAAQARKRRTRTPRPKSSTRYQTAAEKSTRWGPYSARGAWAHRGGQLRRGAPSRRGADTPTGRRERLRLRLFIARHRGDGAGPGLGVTSGRRPGFLASVRPDGLRRAAQQARHTLRPPPQRREQGVEAAA